MHSKDYSRINCVCMSSLLASTNPWHNLHHRCVRKKKSEWCVRLKRMIGHPGDDSLFGGPHLTHEINWSAFVYITRPYPHRPILFYSRRCGVDFNKYKLPFVCQLRGASTQFQSSSLRCFCIGTTNIAMHTDFSVTKHSPWHGSRKTTTKRRRVQARNFCFFPSIFFSLALCTPWHWIN